MFVPLIRMLVDPIDVGYLEMLAEEAGNLRSETHTPVAYHQGLPLGFFDKLAHHLIF